MAEHSSVVGGSNAGRLIGCPASYSTTAALPLTNVEVSSEYAEEGTHLHHVSSALMQARQRNNDADLFTLASSFVGRHFYDRIFTVELLNEAIEPALHLLAQLEKEYGGGFKVIGVERRVNFPGIPGAFGTADVLLQSRKYVVLNDWKYGSGVPVRAVYVETNGDQFLNAQLLFYLTAAVATLQPALFGNRLMVGAIIQPRVEDPLTHAVIDPEELTMFMEDLQAAVIKALGRNPPRARGEWCRFAPCKLTCPLWTGPVLDLSMTMLNRVVQKSDDAKARTPTPYGAYLAAAKVLADQMLIFKTELDAQIHAFLEDGGVVPGWRLKPKTKNRQWVAETLVVPVLKKLGFADSEIWQKKLQTFTSVDATAKRRKVVIPEDLRVAPPSNETTVCAADDPAPAVEHAQAARDFQRTLKKLIAER